MIRAVSCLAIALLVSTPGAFAADAATCGEQFRAADLNNDGVLSRSEIGDAKSKLPSGIFRTRIYHAHRLYGRMHQQRLIGRRKLLSVVRTIRHVKAADQPAARFEALQPTSSWGVLLHRNSGERPWTADRCWLGYCWLAWPCSAICIGTASTTPSSRRRASKSRRTDARVAQ